MSHTTKINIENFLMSEFEALKLAFNDLGWRIEENGKSREYGGKKVDYPWVAINPASGDNVYDVGIRAVTDAKSGEEKLELLTDFYGGSVASILGENFGVLRQHYCLEVIKQQFPYAYSTHTLENGDIEMEVDIPENETV